MEKAAMYAENWQKPLIDELLSSPVGQILEKAMSTIAEVQKHLYALVASEDSPQLKLLEIATVFQLFLVRTLASGKKFSEIGRDGWKNIAEKISKYAILNDESSYSEFVFLSYASYIDGSAKLLSRLTRIQDTDSILELSATIRSNTEASWGALRTGLHRILPLAILGGNDKAPFHPAFLRSFTVCRKANGTTGTGSFAIGL